MVCTGCHVDKKSTEFYKNTRRCKVCCLKAFKQRRKNNLGEFKKREKKYRAKRKLKQQEYYKKWYWVCASCHKIIHPT